MNEEQLFQGIIDGKLFGHAECEIEAPNHLRRYFSRLLPILKNTIVSKEETGTLMREYAKKENIMAQLRGMLISSVHLTDGTLITSILLFYFKLGLVCQQFHRFVQYNAKKCLNTFVQSAVNARRQRDENPISSVVAETMKLLANSSYVYQIMDRSRHTVTNYLNDEKTHNAIDSKLFRCLNQIAAQLYEFELAKPEIKQRDPILVGFFILQYAKQSKLELHINFIKTFRDADKFEKLGMDTDSLYLTLSEETLKDVSLPEKRSEWNAKRLEDCTDTFAVNATDNFFPRMCCNTHTRNAIRGNQISLRKKLDVQKCYIDAIKLFVAMMERITGTSFAAKV